MEQVTEEPLEGSAARIEDESPAPSVPAPQSPVEAPPAIDSSSLDIGIKVAKNLLGAARKTLAGDLSELEEKYGNGDGVFTEDEILEKLAVEAVGDRDLPMINDLEVARFALRPAASIMAVLFTRVMRAEQEALGRAEAGAVERAARKLAG